MSQRTHTQLPWKEHEHQTVAGSHLIINSLGDTLVARCGKENATFIVTACNAHHQMLTALKDILSRFVDCIGIGGEIDGDKEAITKARDAITKATVDAA